MGLIGLIVKCDRCGTSQWLTQLTDGSAVSEECPRCDLISSMSNSSMSNTVATDIPTAPGGMIGSQGIDINGNRRLTDAEMDELAIKNTHVRNDRRAAMEATDRKRAARAALEATDRKRAARAALEEGNL